MKKFGGLVLAAAFLLTGCAAPATDTPAPSRESIQPVGEPKWVSKDGQPFDANSVTFKDSALADFKAAAAEIPGFTKASDDYLASIGHDLCEHYASGFTTDDLAASSVSGKAAGEALANLGEAAKATVCAKP